MDIRLRELVAHPRRVADHAAQQPEGAGDEVVDGGGHDDAADPADELPGEGANSMKRGMTQSATALDMRPTSTSTSRQGVQHRLPGELRLRDVDDAGPGHSGQAGVGELLGLGVALDRGGHGDAVAVGQLSSSTVLRSSILVASTGPSQMIQNVAGPVLVGLAPPEAGEDPTSPRWSPSARTFVGPRRPGGSSGTPCAAKSVRRGSL